MNIGKTLTVFALSAAILTSACSVGGAPQDLASVDHDQPHAELVVEDHYNPVHEAGKDAIQAATNEAGIGTIVPGEIHESLTHPSVEGYQDSEMGTQTFSARFTNDSGNASYEVSCTNEGVGDGLAGGTGPLTHVAGGIIFQQTGPGQYSSDWIQTSNGGHCQIVSQGMTLNQTVRMSSSIESFAPDFSGALIAQ